MIVMVCTSVGSQTAVRGREDVGKGPEVDLRVGQVLAAVEPARRPPGKVEAEHRALKEQGRQDLLVHIVRVCGL